MTEIDYVKIAAYLGGAIAMGIGTIGPSLSQGRVAAQGLDSMGRYPEMSNKIRMALYLALGVIETISLYAFIIALLLVWR